MSSVGTPTVDGARGSRLFDQPRCAWVMASLDQLLGWRCIFQSVDKDGTYSGYDIESVKQLTNKIKNPIIIAGGCKNIEEIKTAFDNDFSGAAAGSLFVYYSDLKGILINYPSEFEFYEAGIKR